MESANNQAGFLIISFPPQLARKVPIPFGESILGRSEAKAQIVIKQGSISQKHASIKVTKEGVWLTDLNSKNGTKINASDNFIESGKEVMIDESMIIHFADVQCQIKLSGGEDKGKSRQSVEQKPLREKKRHEAMKMFGRQQDLSRTRKLSGTKKDEMKPEKDEFQKTELDDSDIEEDFAIFATKKQSKKHAQPKEELVAEKKKKKGPTEGKNNKNLQSSMIVVEEKAEDQPVEKR